MRESTATEPQPINYGIRRIIGDAIVFGFVTTDGTIGELIATNIVDWFLILEDGNGATIVLDATFRFGPALAA